MTLAIIYVLIGVAISVSLGAIGSASGVGKVTSTGAGLLSKEPEKYPQVLALAALPSTQALYGLLFGFILLIEVGLLGGQRADISNEVGLAYMLSAIPVGVACLASGFFQGSVAASGLKIVSQKPENFTQAVVLAALIESFAIFGLVISLLIVFVGISA
jgi:V/A-type H+-transporting ATPase subunit K